MLRSKICILLAPLALVAIPASAATVVDPAGDFLPGYVGPKLADLDVTSFSLKFNATTNIFTIGASFAGDIDPSTVGFYVFGVNTGTGTIKPFSAIGEGNVIFNQAIVINKDGTGSVGGTALSSSSISIVGNLLTAQIPLSLLPSTGFAPQDYGFNLWPRIGNGNNNQITDFSPENANFTAAGALVPSPAPEPSTWALLLAGFGVIGYVLRRQKRSKMQSRGTVTA